MVKLWCWTCISHFHHLIVSHLNICFCGLSWIAIRQWRLVCKVETGYTLYRYTVDVLSYVPVWGKLKLSCCTGLAVIDLNLSVQGYVIQCAMQRLRRSCMSFCPFCWSAKHNKVVFFPGLCLPAASEGEVTLALHCADVAVEAGMVVVVDLDDEHLSVW